MRSRLLLVLSALLLPAGCDGGLGPDPEQTVATVTVAPSDTSLTLGDSWTPRATLRAADGTVLLGRSVTWASSNEAVAEVSASGAVTALAVGSARITATSEGKTGALELLVVTPTVESVELDHSTAEMEEGDQLQLVATPRDAEGDPIPGLGIQWSSSAPDVAQVDALGRVTAVRTGTATITARVHGEEASATVAVTASYPYDLVYSVAGDGTWSEVFRLDLREAGASPDRLFPQGVQASQPAFSPDGSRVAFVCPSPMLGDPGICVSGPDGSDPELIAYAIGAAMSEPVWSADGTRLAFVRSEADGPSGTALRSRIWVMDADGTDALALTAGMEGNQISPAWSPTLEGGEERIAFASGTGSQLRIWTMLADGSDRQQITTGADLVDSQPAWSPDGGTIVFQRISPMILADLWLVDAAGGNERSLTGPRAGAQAAPAWSPDGRLVAFVSTHETYGSGELRYQVYTVWADGTKLARRTFDAGDKLHPSWLPRP